jgi:long-subunit acyl-CoA synthetase (AMP-forming)
MDTIKFFHEQIEQLNKLRATYLSKKMTVWEEQSYNMATKECQHYEKAIQALRTIETLDKLGIKSHTNADISRNS